MSGDCLCLNLGIECWCARPGPGGFGYAPHGTLAGARRHYRRDGAGWQCGPCRQAEGRRWRDRQRRKREQQPPAAPGRWPDRAAPGAGRRIREMREEAGMSQVELAAALGVPQATLSGWETGRNRPAAAVLARVAAATQAGERSRAA